MIVVWVSGAKLIGELQWDILKKARKFFHPAIKQVIILALLGVVLQNANELGIKVYKSFQKDLNAIYLNREESNIRMGWERYYIDKESIEGMKENREGIVESYKEAGEEIIVYAQPEGYMKVKNCSRHTVGPFKVHLMIKEDFKAFGMEEALKEYTYELPDEYIIGAGQEEIIRFHNSKFEEKSLEFRGKGHTSVVNVVLISDNEKCVFENQYY